MEHRPDDNLHDALLKRFEDTPRSFKREQKIASSTDQSHQKKSDRDQTSNQASSHMAQLVGVGFRGRVISIEARAIFVQLDSSPIPPPLPPSSSSGLASVTPTSTIIECQIKGQLKFVRTEEKNLVAAGDWVWIDDPSAAIPRIQAVEPRSTILSRADNLSGRKQQIIAANNDYVCIVLSAAEPTFRPHLADRYLVSVLSQAMTPIIIINKFDLLEQPNITQEAKEIVAEFVTSYRAAGFKVITLSAYTGEGLDELKTILKDHTCVFSGQSGVGKSSIINILAKTVQRIGGLTAKTNKGSHTTTAPKLLPLPEGGWCIDTPGIGSFGLWLITSEMIRPAYPDLFALAQECYYPNCSHTHETECAVKLAIEEGRFSPLRLDGYLILLNEVSAQTHHQRR